MISAVELADAFLTKFFVEHYSGPEAKSFRHAFRRECTPKLAALLTDIRLEEAKELREALDRVNDIRNSIIGCQGFNFSMHAYPLVAALGAVGIEGMSYEDAFLKRKEIDAKILKWQVEANERIAALEAERRKAIG